MSNIEVTTANEVEYRGIDGKRHLAAAGVTITVDADEAAELHRAGALKRKPAVREQEAKSLPRVAPAKRRG